MKVIDRWMIYGANGYTGELLAREAVKRGHLPILAGRTESSILPLAEELDLNYRVFDLTYPRQIKQNMEGIGLVINCAGPFSRTAEPIRGACMDIGVHYLDITGEIAVLEDSFKKHDAARDAGVVIISGVGFDVVPTDLLANLLHKALPEGDFLEMAFAGEGGLSPGTAKTMLEMMDGLCKIRSDGEIITVPLAYKVKEFDFEDKKRVCMTIPWGDIATTFYSTGIPNIEVYTAIEKSQVKWVRFSNKIISILKSKRVKRFLENIITKGVHGPDEETRRNGFMQLVGRITHGDEERVLKMKTPEGYEFTVLSSLHFVEQVLSHKVMPGAYTPAQAFELDELLELEIFTLID